MRENTVTPREWLGRVLAHHWANRLKDTLSIRRLPRFQRDAALRVRALLDSDGGCLLADDVGLGKTHMAAAVVSSCREVWGDVLIIAPAAVLPKWRATLGEAPSARLQSYAALVRQPPVRAPDLLVVDEAHRLRNPSSKRHRIVEQLARRSRLLLITATPMHNSSADVRSLLGLLVGLPPRASGEHLARALARRMVRRVQASIDWLYGSAGVLGTRPRSEGRLETIAVSGELRGLLAGMGRTARACFPELGHRSGLLEGLLLRRLESSPAAYLATLRRCAAYLDRAMEAAAAGRALPRRDYQRLFGAVGSQAVFSFMFDTLPPVSASGLLACRDVVSESIARAEVAATADDTKRDALDALLGTVAGPTVVVTAFEATARHLIQGLVHRSPHLVTGRYALVGGRRVSRGVALRAFSPEAPPSDAVLIATDVVGEGLDLQGARHLVHYDRPWNPMVLAQREGRLLRLGSPHQTVRITTLRRPEGLESRLRVGDILSAKRRAIDELLGDDLVGLDRVGLVQGLWWATGTPAAIADVVHSGTTGARMGGQSSWLLAFGWGGDVRFVRVRETGDPTDRVGLAPFALVAQALDAAAAPSDENPGAEAVEAGRWAVRDAILADLWCELEPSPGARRPALVRYGACESERRRAPAGVPPGRPRLLGVLSLGNERIASSE